MQRTRSWHTLIGCMVMAMAFTPALHASSGPLPDAPEPQASTPISAPTAPAVPSREQQRLLMRSPAPGEAQQPLQSSGDRSVLGQIAAMGLPLLAVLALIAGCAWVFRKMQASGRGGFGGTSGSITSPSGIVSVLGRYSLGTVGSPKQNLLLLQVDRRVLLIGQTLPARGQPGSLSTLCELAEPEDVASVLIKVSEAEESGPASRFSSMLHTAGAQGEGDSSRLGGLSRLFARLSSRPDAPLSWTETLPASAEAHEAAALPSRGQSALRTRPSVRARLSSINAQPKRAGGGVA